jgi:hypothetical protein
MNRQTVISETQPRRRIGKASFSPSPLTSCGVFPPWGQPVSDGPLLLATAYRTVYGVVGSYIAARLAPYRPMQHALAGGVVGFVVSVVGAIVT